MTEQPHEFERRALNEAIENTYLNLVDLICEGESNIRYGRGSETNIHRTLYNEMYHLYLLTSKEEELINNAKDDIAKLREWLQLPAPGQKEGRRYVSECIEIFEKYDSALHSCGIIVLPRRSR